MPPRAPLFAMLAATLTLFSPLSAHSQTATDPAEPSRRTDFAFMAAKAKTDPELGQLFRQLNRCGKADPNRAMIWSARCCKHSLAAIMTL